VQNAASSLTRSFDTTLAAVKANRPKKAPRVVFLYAHSPSDASIYGTEGGANELIELAGGKNAAPFKDTKALTAEALVALNPDATAALERAKAVKVKPLVWEKGIVDWAKPLPGMKYVTCSTFPYGCWAWWLDGAEGPRTVERDEAAAKAAAQADYTARILAALEGP
jgi:hypothetical protein